MSERPSFVREDLERALLGEFVLNPSLLSQAVDLSEDDFTCSAHRLILKILRQMAANGEFIDIHTLSDRLELAGQLESIGGHAYVAGLLLGLTERPDVRAYVRILKQNGLRRRLAIGLKKAANRAQDIRLLSEILPAAQRAIWVRNKASTDQSYGELLLAEDFRLSKLFDVV